MASEKRRNRPYAPRMSKEDRRDQLLNVAVGIVRKLGAQALNMDAVAKAAGVTRPVVYRVFDDAGDLFDAMLDREEEAALAQLAEVLPNAGSGDPAVRFSSSANRNYAVEHRADLTTGTWDDLDPAVPGTGSEMTVEDPAGGPGHNYRLRVEVPSS